MFNLKIIFILVFVLFISIYRYIAQGILVNKTVVYYRTFTILKLSAMYSVCCGISLCCVITLYNVWLHRRRFDLIKRNGFTLRNILYIYLFDFSTSMSKCTLHGL